MRVLAVLFLISALLFIGCAEKTPVEEKTTPQPEATPPPATQPSEQTSTTELVDTAVQEDLTELTSAIVEVESLMKDLEQLENMSFDL